MKIIAVKMSGLELKDLETTGLAWKQIDEFAAEVNSISVNLNDLYQLGDERGIDFLPVPHAQPPKLALFDMDSTLVAGEVINQLAALKNCEPEITLITNRAMNGEIDFDESLRLRLSHLQDITTEELSTIHSKLPLNPGAKELISAFKKLGIKNYIASGGFDFFAKKLASDLEMDGCFSNQLEMIDGKTTGKVIGEIINAKKKKEILITKAQEYGISLQETIAIGDGANDLEMIQAAGFGIAYHAKPIVKEKSPLRLSHNPLHTLLYLWEK
ncbi:MAG TPA: phosphoserine phosphatase SerB [Bacteriovoracaceae bacterium]|nr:phosphoserine phosphatase SerB [Bacteriovoracaceae bacterium]